MTCNKSDSNFKMNPKERLSEVKKIESYVNTIEQQLNAFISRFETVSAQFEFEINEPITKLKTKDRVIEWISKAKNWLKKTKVKLNSDKNWVKVIIKWVESMKVWQSLNKNRALNYPEYKVIQKFAKSLPKLIETFDQILEMIDVFAEQLNCPLKVNIPENETKSSVPEPETKNSVPKSETTKASIVAIPSPSPPPDRSPQSPKSPLIQFSPKEKDGQPVVHKSPPPPPPPPF